MNVVEHGFLLLFVLLINELLSTILEQANGRRVYDYHSLLEP